MFVPKKAFVISCSHEAELKYKSYNNKLMSILRFAKKAYYSKMLEKQKNNVKGIWKIVNTVINKQFNPPTYPAYFMGNDEEICDKQDIANGFNNFFTNIGPNLAKQITLPKKVFDYLGKELDKGIFLSPVPKTKTLLELFKILRAKCQQIVMI